MMKRKGLWSLIGFLLIVIGFTAIVLQMIGISWSFLAFLDSPGRLFAFVAKLLLLMAGVIIAFLVNVNWEKEWADSSREEEITNQNAD